MNTPEAAIQDEQKTAATPMRSGLFYEKDSDGFYPWDLKSKFLSKVKERGGFVNGHLHLDKSFYISKGGLEDSMVAMEKKWRMSDSIKRADTQKDIEKRIELGLQMLMHHGVSRAMSFIDAYSAVGTKAIDAAVIMQEKYKDNIEFLTSTQPLGGLVDASERNLFEEVSSKADTVGGLPSFDRPNDDKHFDALFSIAKNLNKPLHVHIDQENNPNERDTEKLISYTKKHGYEGRVVAVHAVSTSAQPKKLRQRIYKELADLGIAVIVCPSAMLSQKQLDHFVGPIHNSIANVPEMLEAGVLVGLGSDDMRDFYLPFTDGDMWTEIRMLMEACRFYDFPELLNICTTNGQKILSIT